MAEVSEPEAKVTVYCVPAVPVMPRPVKVATPADTVAVVVPTSVPPAEIDAVTTVDTSEVSTLPELSVTETWGTVVNTAPEAVPTADRERVSAEAAPAETVTAVDDDSVAPPIVALTVAVPGVDPGDKVAVYVPLPLSVTEPSDPSVVLIVTVAPPLLMVLPVESFACTVMVVPEPPAVSEDEAAEIVEVDADAVPGVTLNAADVADVRPDDVKVRYLLTPEAPE